MRRYVSCLALLTLVFVAPVAAQSVSTDSAAARLAKGKQLFEGKGLCFSCHGKSGEGVVGPKLVGRPLVHAKPTIADVSALIRTGVDSAHSTSGQLMPARGGSRLTDAEVEMVAAYVLELQKRKGS